MDIDSSQTCGGIRFVGSALRWLDRHESYAQNLCAIDDALAAIEQQRSSLIGLTPEPRLQLTNMDDKSEALCRQADVLGENPDTLPRDFDLRALRRDLQMLDVLRPRIIRMRKLQ